MSIETADAPARSVEIGRVLLIGRSSENGVCIEDPNVSRYHAAIEARGDRYWLTDLDSANGTFVNSKPLSGECELRDGDVVELGGVARLEFSWPNDDMRENVRGVAEPEPQPVPVAASPSVVASLPDLPSSPEAVEPPAARHKTGVLFAVAAVAVAVVCTAVFVMRGDRPYEIRVKIRSPHMGARITETTTVRVAVEDPDDVQKVLFLVDGKVVDTAERPPFDGILDPAELAKASGVEPGMHELSVVIVDGSGRKIPQSDAVTFELAVPAVGNAGKNDSDETASGDTPSEVAAPSEQDQIRAWAGQLASQISGKSGYEFEAEFLVQIRLRTGDYRMNFTNDVLNHKRDIVKVFGDQNAVKPVLATYLAAHRTKFGRGGEGGPWGVPEDVMRKAGVVGQEGSEAAATYTRAIVTLFDPEDFMYAVACYGMTPAEAAEVKRKLETAAPEPGQRRNFWRMVKAGVVPREGADRVARFLAAGVVGENPRAFGVDAEPLSSLF